jgi:hypothetical protein
MYSLFCWTVNSRELDVLHVPMVAFESQAHRVDLLEHFRHDLFHGEQVGLSPGDKGEATGNVLVLVSSVGFHSADRKCRGAGSDRGVSASDYQVAGLASRAARRRRKSSPA